LCKPLGPIVMMKYLGSSTAFLYSQWDPNKMSLPVQKLHHSLLVKVWTEKS